jgi:hypothetical protein
VVGRKSAPRQAIGLKLELEKFDATIPREKITGVVERFRNRKQKLKLDKLLTRKKSNKEASHRKEYVQHSLKVQKEPKGWKDRNLKT